MIKLWATWLTLSRNYDAVTMMVGWKHAVQSESPIIIIIIIIIMLMNV